MEDIVKKLKFEEKINFKLDILNLKNLHIKKIIEISVFMIFSMICFANYYFFGGILSFLIVIIYGICDRITYAKNENEIFDEYFKIKPKK